MDDPNYSLFDEDEFRSIPKSAKAALAIRKGNRKKLSKAQNQFNRLTKRITELQGALERRRELFDTVLAAWSEQMPQLDAAFGERQLRIALQLDKAGKRFKFGSVQILKLQFAIITLIREAYAVIAPSDEADAVFERWNGKEFRKVEEEEFEAMKSAMEEGFRESFGMDIDLGDFDMSEESFARFSAEFRARVIEDERQKEQHGHMSAREMQAELHAKLEAERIKRSIRTVYLNIAKALHPDTTLDEEERVRRDDVMKTVTVAYDDNDLQTLLRIEMIELERGSDRINHLPDETLALYNASLKEQVEELQMELYDLRLQPRYVPISSIISRAPDFAENNLHREIAETKQLIERCENTLTILTDEAPKQDLLAVLDKFCKDYDEEFAMWSGRPLKRPAFNFYGYRGRY